MTISLQKVPSWNSKSSASSRAAKQRIFGAVSLVSCRPKKTTFLRHISSNLGFDSGSNLRRCDQFFENLQITHHL